MKKVLTYPLPLYGVVAILLLVAGCFVYVGLQYRHAVYNYQLLLPSVITGQDTLQYGSWPALSNADFFAQVRDRFVEDESSFIEADLSAMKLRVWEKGVVVEDLAIITKGKEGSWWETPAGLYRIETKEKNHFSSFGHVYQPWSMAFQGNFFIHGWPYYPDGTPVATAYSGGCIRMSNVDAEKVFSRARVGMPVLVFSNAFASDAFAYEAGPQVSAQSYLAADLKNNFVFAEKDTRSVRPIASITKLMTALIATEYINLDKEVSIDSRSIIYTSKPRLKAGQTITAYQLLFPLLLESSNEAANALAYSFGFERFVGLMNDKAKALGMVNTHFTDPTGKDIGNASTQEDLFVLAKYLLNNRSFILKISSGKLTSSVYGDAQFTDLKNFNLFEGDPAFIGGKVGETLATGETMLALFTLTVDGQERPIAVSVLNTPSRENDVKALRDYVATNFR